MVAAAVTVPLVLNDGPDHSAVPVRPVTAPSDGSLVHISIILERSATDDDVNAISDALKETDGVREARFLDQTETYQRFTELFGNQPGLVAVVRPEDLPEMFDVTVVEPLSEDVADRIRDLGGVRSVTGGPVQPTAPASSTPS